MILPDPRASRGTIVRSCRPDRRRPARHFWTARPDEDIIPGRSPRKERTGADRLDRQIQKLSIVVPVMNEEANLPELHRRVAAVMDRYPRAELLLVDDGSTDRTRELIREIGARDPRVWGLSFSRNFGHQAAILAGYDHATGDVVVSMDGDLQHPPECIPDMVARWAEGNDIVQTFRDPGQEKGFLKAMVSRVYYAAFRMLTPVPLSPHASDFRALDRKVVDFLKELEERHRFLRGLVAWSGFRQVNIPIQTAPRFAGTPSYSWRKLMRLGMDGIFAFSYMPLRWIAFFGTLVSLVGFSYALYVLVAALIGVRDVPGFATVIIAVLILGGGQMIAMGVLGEYVGRIYDEVKRRPNYLIAEQIGGPPPRT